MKTKKNRAESIRKLLAEGLETPEIAKRVGVSTNYVSQVKWHWQGGKKSNRIKFVKQNAQKLMASRFTVPKLKAENKLVKSIEQARNILLGDMVNSPAHYTKGGIETIDFIEAKGLDGDYHIANAIKYLSRAPHKENYLEDLKKARWYLTRRIEKIEGIKSQG